MQIDKENINSLADKIRLVLDMKKPPYDPNEAIKKLGGSVKYIDDVVNFDAFLKKTDHDSFEIQLGSDSPSTRSRFTLAHEIGHLFLHMGFLINKTKWDSIESFEDSVYFRSNMYSLEEYEANEFAAAFLMPKNEFIEIAEEHLNKNTYDLEPIAVHFNVSTEAVANRGKWLGVFRW